MKAGQETHLRIDKTFQGATEGWVKAGRIFNVGKEHTPGLEIISEIRAKQLVQRKLASHVAAEEEVADAPSKDKNDPLNQFEEGQRRVAGETRPRPTRPKSEPGRNVAIDSPRRTKIDPPNKKKLQEEAPAAPKRAAPGAGSPPGTVHQPPQKLENGSPTGADASSPLSSEEVPPAAPSTGRQRGLRRGTVKGASAGSVSTKVTASSQSVASSTAPTGHGGDSAKESKNSED